MSFDYNYFSKAELVAFLITHEKDFRRTRKPYSIMLEEKQDKVFNELDKLSKENDRLLDEFNNSIDEDKLKIVPLLQNNHKKWEKLYEKLDEYSKKLEIDD